MKNIFYPLIVLFSLLVVSGCVKDEFDEPPAGGTDPNITSNTTIADLKALHQLGDFEEITEDVIIEGVVIADDQSGNFYKTIVIQDETGGIQLSIEGNSLYTTYRIGRRIFVKCQGLYLGDYNNVIQIGGGTSVDPEFNELELDRIPTTMLNDIIFLGEWDVPVEPAVKSITELGFNDISTLVTISEAEFSPADRDQPYADAVTFSSINRTINGCNGGSILLRTSGYCSFANDITPSGSGSITAVFSVFGTDAQLFIRTPEDVQMEGTACNGGGTGTVTGEQMSIEDLRAVYNNGGTSAPADSKIKGIVISDANSGNFNFQNIVLQEPGGAGIIVRFDDAHSYQLNDEVEVTVSGATLSVFPDDTGALQVTGVGGNVKTGTGSISPEDVDIIELVNNMDAYESELIRIVDGTVVSGDPTYAFGHDINDGTGTIELFTSPGANFAGEAFPSGTGTIIAIASRYNDVQILIRDTYDMIDFEGGTGGGGDVQVSTIADIRDAYANGITSIAANSSVSGVVISDKANGNTNLQNIVVQDGNSGIVFRFVEEHFYPLGEEVTINLSGLTISEFNGLLQVSDISLDNVTNNVPGTLPTPATVTIDQLMNNGEALESTLVQIDGVTISTLEFEGAVSDGSNSIPIFTSPGATFSGSTPPSGEVTLTAIVSEYNARQVYIRNLNDIEE